MSLTLTVARSRTNGRGRPGVGDPGLFGSIGRIVGKVAGVAKAIPGPIGWAGAAVSKIMPSRQPVSVAGVMQRPLSFAPTTGMPQMQQPAAGPLAFAQRLIPGGETGMEMVPYTKIACPSGYHANKSDYFLKDGTFVEKESRCVKNRYRNPLNPRAASKAIGRIESLKRATSRFSRITIRKKCP